MVKNAPMRIAGDSERGISKRVAFTMQRLAAAAVPAGKGRQFIYDSVSPGLCLMVTEGGSKSFYLYRKVNGRPQRIRLGGFPDIGVDQARKLAEQVRGKIAQGVDPGEQRRLARGEITFGELAVIYLERHAKAHNATWEDDQEKIDLHLEDWKTRKISEITRELVHRLHAKIGADSPYAANRVLALVKSIFNRAGTLIGYEGRNPAIGIERFVEAKRDRFLSRDEMPKFLAAVDSEPSEVMKDFFSLLLFTGARRGNVQAMRFADINLPTKKSESGTWLIPATEHKAGKHTGENLTVVLPMQAVEILRRRKSANEALPPEHKSEWVFPSSGKSGHIEEPKGAWKALLKRAGIEGLRLHDLRRTHGSWQAALGTSLAIIGKSLGHKNASTTQVYARLNLDPVRDSVVEAVDAMLGTAGKKR